MLPVSGRLVAFTVANLGAERGRYRLEAESHVVDPEGVDRGTLGPFPGDEMFANERAMGLVVFGAHTCAAISVERLVVGTQDETELRLYGLDGALRRIVRWPEGDRSVEGPLLSDYTAWIEEGIAAAPEAARDHLRSMMEALPMAERLPAYGELVGGEHGAVWVGSYPGQPAVMGQARMPARTWLVFDGDGAVVATLRTPEGFQPHAVEDRRVWGVYKDELDVESVRAYAIEKGG